MQVINRKAKFNYQVFDKYEAGIMLTGAEVKSCKLGAVSLGESHVRITGNELYLINANISPYKFANNTDYTPTRSRKLLLHRKEILRIQKQMEGKKLTLVATKMYTKKRRVKLEIALARGKKQFEKKEKKKRRDLDREQQKALKKY